MDINDRLQRLRARRRGLDRPELLSEPAQREVLAKALVTEQWQRRATNQPQTQYALGAMQEVDPESTAVSLREADRVGKQLHAGFSAAGKAIAFELQGSVPLNVHIRGFSDVDLLLLSDSYFLTYTRGGAKDRAGHYTPTNETSMGVLLDLRARAPKILRDAFPAATVDTSGSKAIRISKGSLAREVDVVPSHWDDNLNYQASGKKHDRGVTILDTKGPSTIANLPFLHIQRVSDRCHLTSGGLRKAIRLVKTVKADAVEEGARIMLPSFDIAAMMYHADASALATGAQRELAILAEAQRHVSALSNDHAHALTLVVPDGSRAVFDSVSKLEGLDRLARELEELVERVAMEQNRLAAAMYTDLMGRRKLVEASYVP